jgi:hypothetical protein
MGWIVTWVLGTEAVDFLLGTTALFGGGKNRQKLMSSETKRHLKENPHDETQLRK